MKKQISANEIDLKTSYILFSFIPFLIGSVFLVFMLTSNDPIARSDHIRYFSLAFTILGLLCIITSSLYVPYCYKIEVDNNKIYITKSESIITTQIEKTIEIDKDLLEKVTGSFLGFSIFYWHYNLHYLNFKEETEYGRKIAFLSKLTPGYDNKYPELRKLKKEQ